MREKIKAGRYTENIAYAFCHFEPLDEAKESLTPTCHCEATKWPWQSQRPTE